MLFDCRKLLLAVWGVGPESEAESVRFPWVQSDKAGPESRKLPPEELASRSELGDLEIWFVDECGVEGDPRPRRRWSARGSRPKSALFGRPNPGQSAATTWANLANIELC
jgi:hypothetical protein